MTQEEVRLAEEAAFRAWPGQTCRDIGGWLACASASAFSRGNSVWPLRFSGAMALDAAIAEAEHFYRLRGQPAKFQVLDAGEPAGLDDALAERGYRREQPSLLMAKGGLAISPVACDVAGAPDPEWLAVYGEDIAPERRASVEAILARLPKPHAYFSRRVDGRAASICLCVVDGDHAVVQAMTTRADMRRHGHATALLGAVETWAAEEGAQTLVLQVDGGNGTARHLYEKCGFATVSGYHYRVLPRETER